MNERPVGELKLQIENVRLQQEVLNMQERLFAAQAEIAHYRAKALAAQAEELQKLLPAEPEGLTVVGFEPAAKAA